MKIVLPLHRGNVRVIREALQDELNKLDWGAKIEVGNAKFGRGNVTFKVEIAFIQNGEVQTSESESFKRYAGIYGLKDTDLGRSFKQGRETFKVIGLSGRASKYPILCTKLSDGKTYKFQPDTVIALLKFAEKAA